MKDYEKGWKLKVIYNDGGKPTWDVAYTEGEKQQKVQQWKTFRNVKKVQCIEFKIK